MLSFDSKVTAKSLYKFNIRHTYTSLSGLATVIVAVIVIFMAYFNRHVLSPAYIGFYIAMAFLFATYAPINLWLKAKKLTMEEGSAFEEPIHYELTDEAIEVSVKGEKASLPYEYIYKIVTTKDTLLIYSNRVNAYIIAKEDIMPVYDQIAACLKEHVDAYKLELKW